MITEQQVKPGTPTAVEAVNLVKTFGSRKAVDGVSMTIPAGSICGVLGPNGAGKTTTVNMLATLSKPTDGTARIFGYDIRTDGRKIRQLIGLTGQFASVDENLTARQNLNIFGRLLGLPRKESRRKSAELLAEFDLSEAADRTLAEFSGGMRRRLDLAASLISNPPLLFLDEPTTGLDPRTRAQMWQTIRRLVSNGTTVLLTTQYLDEADQLADQIIVIDHGRVVADDTPDGLKKSLGEASLQVTLTSHHDSAQVAGIIESVLRTRVKISESAELTAPMDNADKLTIILDQLRSAGISLAEINVRQPSLDEVFFALTGNSGTSAREEYQND